MKRSLILTLAAALTAASAGVSAQKIGDPAAGAKLANTCAACHGEKGNISSGTFPKLAGQYADYLLQSLKDYKSGARNNAIMKGQVAGLSEEDMENLAAYFANQDGDLQVLKRK